jgi:hypothetical protein
MWARQAIQWSAATPAAAGERPRRHPAECGDELSSSNINYHRLSRARCRANSASAKRRHVDLARIGVGVSDQFGNSVDRNRRMHLEDKWGADHSHDRDNVAEEVVVKSLVERRIYCVRARGHDPAFGHEPVEPAVKPP